MRFILLSIFILSSVAGPALADSVDVRMVRSVQLGETPVQTVSTADGKKIYVLTDQGNVKIYSADGQLQGTFEAGSDVTGIAPQGQNVLLLQKAGAKEMVQVVLETVAKINIEGAPQLGNKEAPVTIVVYDDFECPYCAKAVPLFKEVLAAYPDQVQLIFKNFPLGMHKHAQAAAVAGLAAQKQGKFWPLHDLLFDNYNKLSAKKITELAEQAGLNMVKFAQDQKNPQLARQVSNDMQEGQKIGVRGTPSIFVNGRRLPQRSRAAFDQLITAELDKQTAAGKTATN